MALGYVTDVNAFRYFYASHATAQRLIFILPAPYQQSICFMLGAKRDVDVVLDGSAKSKNFITIRTLAS
jgi:hypothetical protein